MSRVTLRRQRIALTALLLPSLAACGSTAQLRGTSASEPGPLGLASGPSTATGQDGRQQAPGQVPTTAAGRLVGTTAPQGAPGAEPTAPGGPSTAPTVGTIGRGMTPTTVRVGIITAQDSAAFGSAFGVKSTDSASFDQRAMFQAIVKYVNERGGVRGRRIVPVYYDFSTTNAATNSATEEQAACDALTQDTTVYAVITAVATTTGTLQACLASRQTILISGSLAADSRFMARYADSLFAPVTFNMTRLFRNLVTAMSAAGYFSSWDAANGAAGVAPVKVGVLTVGTATGRYAYSDGMIPALKALGYTPVVFDQGSSIQELVASTSQAVLRFQAEHVTHVFGATYLFAQQAESQHYRPRYALASPGDPANVWQANAPAAQRNGSMGLGWQPRSDVDPRYDPGVLTPRSKICDQIMVKNGGTLDNRTQVFSNRLVCDLVFFLSDTLAPAGADPLHFRAAVEALGTSFVPASTFSTRFAPTRQHDGAASYRIFADDTKCTCYRYVSGARAAD